MLGLAQVTHSGSGLDDPLCVCLGVFVGVYVIFGCSFFGNNIWLLLQLL
jgi:hypothetical protein